MSGDRTIAAQFQGTTLGLLGAAVGINANLPQVFTDAWTAQLGGAPSDLGGAGDFFRLFWGSPTRPARSSSRWSPTRPPTRPGGTTA